MFVTPVGPAPPPYTSRSGSESHAPPRMLLLLSALPSPYHGVMGPPPAPCPVLQSTSRLSVPATGSPVASPRRSRPYVHRSSGPSLWAGCRPRLPVGLSTGCRLHGLAQLSSPQGLVPRTMTSVLHIGMPCLLQPPRRLRLLRRGVSRWYVRWGSVITVYPSLGPSGLLSHGIKVMWWGGGGGASWQG